MADMEVQDAITPMERAIIHINVADFAVAVERATDATLAPRDH